MAPPKKTPPPEWKEVVPGIYRRTVGKGISKRFVHNYDKNIASPESVEKYIVIGDRPPEDVGLGHFYGQPFDRIRREAEKILRDAKSPANLLSERESKEWYAAEILKTIDASGTAIREGNSVHASYYGYILGVLDSEARERGYFKRTGAAGPLRRKQTKSPYPILARHLQRNFPDETDEHRFKMVPTISDDELELRGYRFYRDAGRIHAEKKVGGKWKPVGKAIKISAFRKHLTEERKRISC